MVFDIIKISFVTKGAISFRTRLSLLESVIVTEFQATEAYSNLDLTTKAKNSISRLSKVENEKMYELTLIVSLHEKKDNRHADGNEVYIRYIHLEPVTVAARSKARNVFARLNTGIVGLNPARGMDVCVYSALVLSCVGSGLATV
jgi:hypothetical protein